MIASMLLALADVEHEAVANFYEAGFRGAASHRGHGLGYDPSTGQWTPAVVDKEWGPDELDEAIADRRPVLLEWLKVTDVAHYIASAGVAREDLDVLRRLLKP